MELPLGILIGIIFGLVILSAFFSGSETSLTAASKARMHALQKSGNKQASNYEKIFNDKERLICTILLANNLVNILASSIATTILLKFFETDGIAYTTIIMTFMILLFGELLPKTIALSNADKIALKISGFFKVLMVIFYPITGFLNSIVGVLIKKLNINSKNLESTIEDENDQELRGAIDLHGDESSNNNEKEMLKSILDLEEVTVDSIMIPRKNTFSLPFNIKYNELLIKLKNSPHSRIPIWKGNPENIIGVFHIRKLLSDQPKSESSFNLSEYSQKPWFIPESTTLASQLMEFKKRKEHFSIVVDEYGEFLGIVTLEDILEEIVGDIDDELDKKKSSIIGVKQEKENVFMVKGTVSIRDLNRELGWDLPDKNFSTIAGLILYESRTIPKIGQIFSFYNFNFEILDKRYNQILLLKITQK
tara:strand:- start:166 stop:1431 length:1266 start_codon:yes stop_codon:yes gene_type:complete